MQISPAKLLLGTMALLVAVTAQAIGSRGIENSKTDVCVFDRNLY
jgi:hypothetical protein